METSSFDGKKFRDEIVRVLTEEVSHLKRKPKMAVFWIGDDFASGRYIEAKEKVAKQIGIDFEVIKYPAQANVAEVEEKILDLNENSEIDGIMIQIPMPEGFDTKKVLSLIDPRKDIDGLRFCVEKECDFRPPVTLSILAAIDESGVKVKESKVAIIGKGFLVGSPLIKMMENVAGDLKIGDRNTPYLATITKDADIIISATGVAGIIQPDMIKEGVVLIDAGTTEVGGKLAGDIDPLCYQKALFYTPVPGGIGPVTVAKLMENVVVAAKLHKKGL